MLESDTNPPEPNDMEEISMVTGHLVRFAYLGPDGEESKRFRAWCDFIPRKGEHILPQAGSSEVEVYDVLYQFVEDPDVDPEHPRLVATVILVEPVGK